MVHGDWDHMMMDVILPQQILEKFVQTTYNVKVYVWQKMIMKMQHQANAVRKNLFLAVILSLKMEKLSQCFVETRSLINLERLLLSTKNNSSFNFINFI